MLKAAHKFSILFLYTTTTIFAFFIIFLYKIDLIESYEECDLEKSAYDPTILNTNYGKLKGACYQVPIEDPDQPNRVENVLFWLSVPYAEAPIKKNRFKKPKPPQPWKDVRMATQWPNKCIQNKVSVEPVAKNVSESEDCLYLNIFVPANIFHKENVNNDSNGINFKSKSAILIYIHGGHFSAGSSSEEGLDLSTHASLSNIICVTINYRLGPFGFMQVDNTEISGNQGFLDQNIAFRWVHENAASFGGDPDKITIGGLSAGSMFSSYHLIYPPSWPYFRNTFLGSGSILYSSMELKSTKESTRRNLAVLDRLGCYQNLTSTDLFECAQKLDASELLRIYNEYYKEKIINHVIYSNELSQEFFLVQDGKAFNQTVKESFKKGYFKKANILTGHTPQEGGLHMIAFKMFDAPYPNHPLTLNYSAFKSFINDFYKYFPSYPNKSSEIFKNNIINEYTFDIKEKNKANYLSTLVKILSEEIYICPTLETAKIFTQYANVFVYEFDHRTESLKFPIEFGTIHGGDMSYVFGEPLVKIENKTNSRTFQAGYPSKFTLLERKLSKRFITYLGNFIKHNDPNIFENSNYDRNEYLYWPKFKPGYTFEKITRGPLMLAKQRLLNSLQSEFSYNYQHLIYQINKTSVSSDYDYLKCNFWKDINNYHI